MGMFDDIKYKNQDYQTKSLECNMGKYEVKNNELWCLKNHWAAEYKPFKMVNFIGKIEIHDYDKTNKKYTSIELKFVDGNLVNEK